MMARARSRPVARQRSRKPARKRRSSADSENIRALRAVLNTFGDGFVEAVDDQTLLNIAAARRTRAVA